jgi:hypothetical protein
MVDDKLKTQDEKREELRQELVEEIKHPRLWYSTTKPDKPNSGLCYRAKFIERNRRDFEKDGDLK